MGYQESSTTIAIKSHTIAYSDTLTAIQGLGLITPESVIEIEKEELNYENVLLPEELLNTKREAIQDCFLAGYCENELR